MWQCAAKIREESMRRGEMTKRGRGDRLWPPTMIIYACSPDPPVPIRDKVSCPLHLPLCCTCVPVFFAFLLPNVYDLQKKNTFVFTACFIRASLPTFLVESGGVHGYLSLHDKITVGDSFWDWSWASAAKHIWRKKMLRKVDWIFFFKEESNHICYNSSQES